MPAGQGEQEEEELGETNPVLQGVHDVETPVENVPAKHPVHRVAPKVLSTILPPLH